MSCPGKRRDGSWTSFSLSTLDILTGEHYIDGVRRKRDMRDAWAARRLETYKRIRAKLEAIMVNRPLTPREARRYHDASCWIEQLQRLA